MIPAESPALIEAEGNSARALAEFSAPAEGKVVVEGLAEVASSWVEADTPIPAG